MEAAWFSFEGHAKRFCHLMAHGYQAQGTISEAQHMAQTRRKSQDKSKFSVGVEQGHASDEQHPFTPLAKLGIWLLIEM